MEQSNPDFQTRNRTQRLEELERKLNELITDARLVIAEIRRGALYVEKYRDNAPNANAYTPIAPLNNVVSSCNYISSQAISIANRIREIEEEIKKENQ